MTRFYRCDCFTTGNIFIKKYKLHCVYQDDSQFWADYNNILSKLGCTSEEEKDLLLHEVKTEILRRQRIEADSCERKRIIATLYVPYNPDVYHLKGTFTSELCA